jgi:ATP-binding cassette, subfamily B, bacterial
LRTGCRRCASDRIVVLSAGRVLEDGSPDHLLRCDGAYRSLIARELSVFGKRAA